MSQALNECTLIGFYYLESYLNPKLSAANLNVDLCSLGEGKALTGISHSEREIVAGTKRFKRSP